MANKIKNNKLDSIEIEILKNNNIKLKKLSRGTKKLIKEAIEKTNSNDRYNLCQYICEELERRYVGKLLDYQLSRMDLKTTGKILDAIDSYLYSSKIVIPDCLNYYSENQAN